MKFEGIVFKINQASRVAPKGASEHRVKLLDTAIQQGLEQLPGRPLFASKGFLTHNRNSPIGIIEHAFIVGDMFCISGHLNTQLTWPLSLQACNEPLGLSYDITNAIILDMAAPIFEISKAKWLGVTVVRQRKAAYREDTLFWLV